MDPLFPETAFSFSVNGLAPPDRLKRQKNESAELHPLYLCTSNNPLNGTECVIGPPSLDLCLMPECQNAKMSKYSVVKASERQPYFHCARL